MCQFQHVVQQSSFLYFHDVRNWRYIDSITADLGKFNVMKYQAFCIFMMFETGVIDSITADLGKFNVMKYQAFCIFMMFETGVIDSITADLGKFNVMKLILTEH